MTVIVLAIVWVLTIATSFMFGRMEREWRWFDESR